MQLNGKIKIKENIYCVEPQKVLDMNGRILSVMKKKTFRNRYILNENY